MANIKKDPQVIELLAKAEKKAAAAQEKAVAKALKDQAAKVKTVLKECVASAEDKAAKAWAKQVQSDVLTQL